MTFDINMTHVWSRTSQPSSAGFPSDMEKWGRLVPWRQGRQRKRRHRRSQLI